MNALQKTFSGAMAAILLGFIAYPEWNLAWTNRLDYQYYYDADLPAGSTAPPPEVWQKGFETEQRHETVRHFLFPKPTPRPAELPPPKSELTGTGAVNLGQRHTRYTGTSALGASATVNLRKMAWEAFVLLIPLGMFLVMFRDNPGPRSVRKPPDPPKFIS